MDVDAKSDRTELQRLCYAPANPQDELNEALRCGSREQFARALQLGADPDRVYPDAGDGKLSVFEVCCQRPGNGEFVRLCVRHGAQVNKINAFLGAAPINLTAESADADNIAALLTNASVQLDRLYAGKTPLSQLIAGLSDANVAARLPAIRLLLQHQANVNACDDRGVPPILAVLKARKLDAASRRTVAELLLAQPSIDLDTHWEGQARQLLQRQFADMRLPAERPAEAAGAFSDAMLLDALRGGNAERFVEACDRRLLADGDLTAFVAMTASAAEDGTNPMQLAIDSGLTQAVEKLLRCGATVRLAAAGEHGAGIGFDAIRRASCFGQHRIVALLLSAAERGPTRAGSVSRALLATVPLIGTSVPARFAHQVDHRRCFDLLLDVVADADLNGQNEMGNTALHLAAIHQQRPVVRQLLRRGASLSVRNAFGELALADIDADVLAGHLDECVGESTDRRPSDEKYELSMRFANFVPASGAGSADTAGVGRHAQKYSNNEMTPIAHIVGDRELKHLAKHPLIASYLFVKWQRMSPAFYLNFGCFAVFWAALIAFIVGQNGAFEMVPVMLALKPVFGLIVGCGCVFLTAREAILLGVASGHYVRQISSYVTIATIVLTVLLLTQRPAELWSVRWGRIVSATLIMLSTAEFFLLLGSLPVLSLSTHLVMLLKVTQSFLKSLLLYSILLGAFALCFFLLLRPDEAPAAAETGADGAEDADEFQKFQHFGLAIVKTFVMMTGEFDAGSIGLERHGFNLVVFAVFVFLVSTVLFNLLNGLAVHDTQVIKADAELVNLIYRAKLLARYEAILGQGDGGCFSALLKRIVSNRIRLFPHVLPEPEIQILPNDHNRVRIPCLTQRPAASDDDKEAGLTNGNVAASKRTVTSTDLQLFDGHWNRLTALCCFGGGGGTSMEARIVRRARALLDRRQRTAAEERLAGERDAVFERRLQQIETSVADIVQRLDRVLETLNN